MIMFSVVRNICETNKNEESEQKLWLWVHSLFRRIMFTTLVLQWCIGLVDSDFLNCRALVDNFVVHRWQKWVNYIIAIIFSEPFCGDNQSLPNWDTTVYIQVHNNYCRCSVSFISISLGWIGAYLWRLDNKLPRKFCMVSKNSVRL